MNGSRLEETGYSHESYMKWLWQGLTNVCSTVMPAMRMCRTSVRRETDPMWVAGCAEIAGVQGKAGRRSMTR